MERPRAADAAIMAATHTHLLPLRYLLMLRLLRHFIASHIQLFSFALPPPQRRHYAAQLLLPLFRHC